MSAHRRMAYNRRPTLRQWKKMSGYAGRRVIARGQKTVLVKYDIPCDNPDVDGNTLLFFSDLHWQGDPVMAEDIRRFIAEHQPDEVIFGGDLVSFSCHVESALALMDEISRGHQALAVPGNWDLRRSWFSVDKWRTLLRRSGFDLLINQEKIINNIRFWGADDFKLGAPDYVPPLSEQFSVVISHNPDAVVDMEKDYDSIDLVLCGHTHAGQIRIPGLGALKTSSLYWRKFDYGHYIHEYTGTHMIVTSGLGTTGIDFRFWCKPEMVLINLCYSH